MNTAPKWRELTELGHTHLERSVQPEGECPACDQTIWLPQRARLATIHRREQGNRTRLCREVFVPHPGVTFRGDKPCDHRCDRGGPHTGRHHCPDCGRYWLQGGEEFAPTLAPATCSARYVPGPRSGRWAGCSHNCVRLDGHHEDSHRCECGRLW